MKNIKLIAGLDIGNGYVKGLIGDGNEGVKATPIDLPSGVAYVTSGNLHDISVSDSEIGQEVENIFNRMDASFASPIVADTNRRWFGKRGVTSGMSIEEFDVYSYKSKSMQPLSGILVLGTLAGKAVQEYWNKHKVLPTAKDVLSVNARIALALPINEFKDYRKEYANGFKSGTHSVLIHNFAEVITVQITFDDVQVTAEGASAQYAITAKGEPLMDVMLADLRKMGEPLTGINSADVLAVKGTVGVDIGEGTVNFPVFVNGKFDPDKSMTYGKGYGTVLNNALTVLRNRRFPFNSRKELAEYLQTTPSALGVDKYESVKRVVEEESVTFANEVAMQFIGVMNRVGSQADVVYVYGGGATPIKSILHKQLLDTANDSFGVGAPPILYLDSRYSRYLNREGLYLIADSYAKKVAKSNV